MSIERFEPGGNNTPAPIVAAEWAMIQEQAKILARTEVVPKRYRGKPDDIIAAGLYGRELGFGLTTSLGLIDVIEGNPELSAEGKNSLIRSRGHSIVQRQLDDNGCVLYGKRSDNGDDLEVSFTYAEAERITISSWKNGNRVTSKLVDKDNWKNYRQDMLFARAMSRLGRRLFGDVLQGFSYSAEEIASFMGEADADPIERVVEPPVRLVRSAPVATDGSVIEMAERQTEPSVASDEPIDVEVVSDDDDGVEPEPAEPLSPAQLNYVTKLTRDLDGDVMERLGAIVQRRVTTIERLSKAEASKVINALQPK